MPVPIGTSVANWSRMLVETKMSYGVRRTVSSVSGAPALRTLSIDCKGLAEFLALQRWLAATTKSSATRQKHARETNAVCDDTPMHAIQIVIAVRNESL